MDFAFDRDQLAWLEEIRAFLRVHLTAELVHEGKTRGFDHGLEPPGPELIRFRAEVAKQGWSTLTWPVEFGGLARSPIYQHILVNEFEFWGAPRIGLEFTSIAPMIIRFGTAENKADLLPRIASGELTFALGYSEPNAGTDLASLRTRAELDGDTWVINGQKAWNSTAHSSNHEWLCVRTDPIAPKHKGLSVIVVPLDAPGIEVRPLQTWADTRTNEVFFTDVRVPKSNLIGEVNQAWSYITGALALERAAMASSGDLRRLLAELVSACRAPLPDGRRPIDDAVVRRGLAGLEADVEVAVLMGRRGASLLESGEVPLVEVTAEKVFGSELRQRMADLGTRVFGLYGLLGTGEPAAVADGEFEHMYRHAPVWRFGGGASEVLRDTIAQRGHGMPRPGR
jgi:3-oxocholest-4-en-26-oyl-CoA dehydrogenase alpha subunit